MKGQKSFDQLKEMISTDLSLVDDGLTSILELIERAKDVDPNLAKKVETIVVGLNNITSRIGENSEYLYQKGKIDQRTQLFTRSYLDELLEILASQGTKYSFAFLMGDVDKFHDYNETFGHVQGDLAVKMVGRTLKSTAEEIFKGFRILPARYGGEELCVLVVEYSNPLEQLKECAEEVRKRIAKTEIEEYPRRDSPENPNFKHVTITIGCGIQLKEEPVQDLIGRVNKYMTGSKKMGKRNTVAVS